MLYIGIDPGLKRTGVVTADGDTGKVVNFATFSSNSKRYSRDPTHNRVSSLACEIGDHMADYPGCAGDEMCVVIERPVYNKNATSFEKQWRLFQAILERLALLFPTAMCLEVANGTAKKVLTGHGGASKLDMICASSFDGPGWGEYDDQEALADAEGIARCGWLSTNAERDRYPLRVHRHPTNNGPHVTGP